MNADPHFSVEKTQDSEVLAVAGAWVLPRLTRVPLCPEVSNRNIAFDLGGLSDLDMSGASLLLTSLARAKLLPPDDQPHLPPSLDRAPMAPHHKALLQAAWRCQKRAEPEAPEGFGLEAMVARLGHGAVMATREAHQSLSFLGESSVSFVRGLARPGSFRWTSVFRLFEDAGVNAVPIIVLLSFFIGMVIAYMGVNLLGMFNAEVFTVELLAFAVLREFGVLLAAIVLAGRTASAFAAELGAMKMGEEIDALRVMGLNPMYILVVPRIFAMIIMLPLLTFIADMAGIAGGLSVLWASQDINPSEALRRINALVPIQHFWVGLLKAPVFGLVLTVAACRQGLLVERDVVSLGARVTNAVVQSLFMVILLDAMFAIFFLEINL